MSHTLDTADAFWAGGEVQTGVTDELCLPQYLLAWWAGQGQGLPNAVESL